jgi:hypothetical protein
VKTLLIAETVCWGQVFQCMRCHKRVLWSAGEDAGTAGHCDKHRVPHCLKACWQIIWIRRVDVYWFNVSCVIERWYSFNIGYRVSYVWIIGNCEIDRMWMKVIVASCKVLWQHFSEGLRKTAKILVQFSGVRFKIKTVICHIRKKQYSKPLAFICFATKGLGTRAFLLI